MFGVFKRRIKTGTHLRMAPLAEFCREVDSVPALMAARGDAILYAPPTGTYRRYAPDSITIDPRVEDPGLAAKLDKLHRLVGSEADFPRQGLARLSGAVVHDTGFVSLDRGILVEETALRIPHTGSACLTAEDGGYRWTGPLPEAMPSDREAVLLRKENDHVYGHWLLEAWPRLGLAPEPPGPGGLDVLVPDWGDGHAMEAIYRDSAVAGGASPDRVRPIDGRPRRFDRLLYPLPVNRHQLVDADHLNDFSPRIRAQAEATRERIAGRSPRPHRLLYVSREDAAHHRLDNEDAVFAQLAPLGFERVLTSRLSFAQQVELFASAACVVGVVGSSLCNLVFCQPGTPVVLLTSSRRSGHWYWDLCCLSDLRCHIVYGSATDRPGAAPDSFTLQPELCTRHLPVPG